jgi:hypothetical protein
LYRRADIIIDQLLIGRYGVLAIEGMAMGKALIAYLCDDLVGYFSNGMPLLNANPDNITAALREAIRDGHRRNEVGRRARAFVEEVHDTRVVARAAANMCRRMAKVPDGPIVPDFTYQLRSSVDFRERFEEDWLRWSQNHVAQLQKEIAASTARIAELEGSERTLLAEIAQLKERQTDAIEGLEAETKPDLDRIERPDSEAEEGAGRNALEAEVAA